MATLVFSTVGNVLGGPVGGAIGALIGQSIDQAIFAPKGPKLGDLKVQSSDYGTPIARVYGTMRVAGTVVWATELEQGDESADVKGGGGTAPSYHASFAVALSSRSAQSVGRIWADGKLLRGSDGDFKVTTEFRFYPGSEAQEVDPLIAAAEGAGGAPAYRGLALAVFERLELADYGNRIPFLTFELIADSEPPTIGAILFDGSGGAIESSDQRTLTGYAVHGSSVRDALDPLIEVFGLPLFDDGTVVRPAATPAFSVLSFEQLGNSADDRREARFERRFAASDRRPAGARLTYFDPARDYQSGEARVASGEQGGSELQYQFPAVLGAGTAKTLAQAMLSRLWASGDRLTLRLPPAYLAIEPGALLDVPLSPGRWRVQQCTIDGFVAVVEAIPVEPVATAVDGDGGRAVAAPDLIYSAPALALVEPPAWTEIGGSAVILLAASSPTQGWRAEPAAVEIAGRRIATTTPRRKSVLGYSETLLGDGQASVLDAAGTLDIALVDPGQWLESRTLDDLANGDNLAMVGRELIQFASATPLGDGRFRLARLLRGRGGTEGATGDHQSGEPFVLLDPNRLTRIDIPESAIGVPATARVQTSRWTSVSPPHTTVGLSLRPLSPVRLTTVATSGGEVMISWVRRSRGGWTWSDGVDVPVGESSERYRVTVAGVASTIETEVGAPSLTLSAAQCAALGGGAAQITAVQVGDHGLSPPATLTIMI